MKNKILFICVLAAALFVWSCNEEPPIGPDPQTQEDALEKVAIGKTKSILELNFGDIPEGITFDKRGNMYVTHTLGELNEILLVKLGGAYKVYATLPGNGQARGLVTDREGNVYVAFSTDEMDTDSRGVYKIKKSGAIERLAGSENIESPNALTFDLQGNLYVSDFWAGKIWRLVKGNSFELWIQHEFLEPYSSFDPFPVPMGGVNGIAFYPPNIMFAANTEKSNLNRIEILPDGSAGNVAQVTPELINGGNLISLDGITLDVNGNVYGVLPAATALGIPPLWKVDPTTGNTTPLPADDSMFDFPTSLAFGSRGMMKRSSVFIVNSDLFGDPTTGFGPGVVQVFVGVPGMPGK